MNCLVIVLLCFGSLFSDDEPIIKTDKTEVKETLDTKTKKESTTEQHKEIVKGKDASSHSEHGHAHEQAHHHSFHPPGAYHLNGEHVSLWWCLPFLGILLSIALLPLFSPKLWHHHYGKISLFWGLAFMVPFALMGNGDDSLKTSFFYFFEVYILEFIPFIVLLMALFAVTGGIALTGTLRGSPKVNTILLGIGVLIASWMGTTGAAMLLIRPVMKANAWREKKVHVIVFFIFLVANIGGSLTPLGDPPLFLGFLKGVSFFWTTTALFIPYVIASTILLIVFFIVDSYFFKKEGTPPDDGEKIPLAIKGKVNFLLMIAIVGSVVLSGIWKSKIEKPIPPNQIEKSIADSITKENFEIAKSETLTFIYHKADNKVTSLFSTKEFKLTQKQGSVIVKGKLTDPLRTEIKALGYQIKERKENFEIWKDLSYDLQKKVHEAHYHLKAGKGNAKILKSLPENVMLDLGGLGLAVQMSYGQGTMIILLIVITFISMRITPKAIRELNVFNWEPILEVAKLFATIFITMVPAIAILKAGTDGALSSVIDSVFDGDKPVNAMFFWATGILSSFLDNAPTYVVFFETASGDANKLMGEMKATLAAISMGAVFMGANTYIGNAPNFMVKSIAEEGGIKMPSFFGYMVWSGIFLIPTFIFLSLIKAWNFSL